MAADLLQQGFELMLVGMGTVFVFLTTLVIVTSLMSRLVMRLEPQLLTVSADGEDAEAEEVAAITAAIAYHRRARR